MSQPRPRTALTGAAIAFLAVAAQAETKPAAPPPPISAEPQNTTAAYGDWVVHCLRANESAPRSCELEYMLQMQNQQGQQSTVAQIALGRPTPKDPYKLVVTLVPSVSFPSSVKLSIDEKDTQPVDVAWLRCTPSACYAMGDFKEDDLKRWKAQTGAGRLTFKDATGKEQSWQFSFRGFAQALDGLAKS